MLIVLRPGPKVFFQYELRFVNRLKCQLLISHLFFPHQRNAVPAGKTSKKSSRLLEDIPALFGSPYQFLFQSGRPWSARSRRSRVPRFRSSLASSNGPPCLSRAFVKVRGAFRKWGGPRPKSPSSPHEPSAKEDLRSRGRRQATISGTHWLMPNAGTLAKDGNSYVFAAEGCESVAFVSTKGARRACEHAKSTL
jgi:hypothetical protein